MVKVLLLKKIKKKIKMAISSKWLVISILPTGLMVLLYSMISVVFYGNANLIDIISFPIFYLALVSLSVNFIISNFQSELDDKSLDSDSSLDDFLRSKYSRKHGEEYKFFGIVVFPVTSRQFILLGRFFVFYYLGLITVLHFYS